MDRRIAEVGARAAGPDLSPSGCETDADQLHVALLFTDIVGSTRLAMRLGDRPFGLLLQAHRDAVREALARHGGWEVDSVGDAFLAAFSCSSAALACATEVFAGARALGIELRAGLHAGPVARVGGRLCGLTVHVGARIVALARPGEILVSHEVRATVAHGEIRLRARGRTPLRGLPGRWSLFTYRIADPEPERTGLLPLRSTRGRVTLRRREAQTVVSV